MTEQPPVAIVRKRRVSLTWLVPLLALAFVVALVWTQVARDRGPIITVRFTEAGGIKPGSELVHRGVSVGVVRTVALDDDLSGVVVTAELAPHAEELAREGTDFWIVRAEVSLQRVSGLDTLLGPNYIAVRPGDGGGEAARRFVALDAPPARTPAVDGSLTLTLRSDRLGSLAPGSPVLYRDLPVGSVRGAGFAPDTTAVLITIDIDPEYRALVYENTRFWRTGGVGVDFGLFRGLTVEAESLDALITSAIALATPESVGRRGSFAQAGDGFELEDAPKDDWLDWQPIIQIGGEAIEP